MKPAIVEANNPCALRPLGGGARWRGQNGVIRNNGGAYCAFAEAVWGVRAGLRNLHTYRARYGLVTPAQVIGRWAPAADRNPETAYARFIARRVGVGVNTPIPFEFEKIRRLIAAIIRFECGFDAIGPDVIAQAMALMAREEEEAGRDPSPYRAAPNPMKPLTRSKEIAMGGGAATIGVGGAIYYGREAVDLGREAIAVGREAATGAGSVLNLGACSPADFACIGSFALLAFFGLAVAANRIRARWLARR